MSDKQNAVRAAPEGGSNDGELPTSLVPLMPLLPVILSMLTSVLSQQRRCRCAARPFFIVRGLRLDRLVVEAICAQTCRHSGDARLLLACRIMNGGAEGSKNMDMVRRALAWRPKLTRLAGQRKRRWYDTCVNKRHQGAICHLDEVSAAPVVLDRKDGSIRTVNAAAFERACCLCICALRIVHK